MTGTDKYYEKYKKEIERLTQDEPYISEQEYEARLKYWRDWLGQMVYAYEAEVQKGIEIGIEKGIEKERRERVEYLSNLGKSLEEIREILGFDPRKYL